MRSPGLSVPRCGSVRRLQVTFSDQFDNMKVLT